MTDTRRGGGERRGAGAQGRAGTRLKVEGDVVMADADENPKWRAQDQRRGRGEMGRRTTGAQASEEEATSSGTRDISWVRRAVWDRTSSRQEAVSECGTATEQSARS